MSPEVVSHRKISAASDVYAFGVVLWELYTSRPIQAAMKDAQVRTKLTMGRWRPKFPEDCPQEYSKLASTCWNDYPNWRPTFDSIASQLTDMLNAVALLQ